MTVHYVDTSALLSIALEGNLPLSTALARARSLTTSALTVVEFDRGILRRRNDGTLNAKQEAQAQRWGRELAAACYLMAVDADVLDRARLPFKVEPVRTLDALHLASIDLLAKKLSFLVVVSTDERVRANALASGHQVLPA